LPNIGNFSSRFTCRSGHRNTSGGLRLKAALARSTANKMNNLQPVAFRQTRLIPSLSRHNIAIQFDRDPVGLQAHIVDQRRQGQGPLVSLVFSVDSKIHGETHSTEELKQAQARTAGNELSEWHRVSLGWAIEAAVPTWSLQAGVVETGLQPS
jgi:hypothetical protein